MAVEMKWKCWDRKSIWMDTRIKKKKKNDDECGKSHDKKKLVRNFLLLLLPWVICRRWKFSHERVKTHRESQKNWQQFQNWEEISEWESKNWERFSIARNFMSKENFLTSVENTYGLLSEQKQFSSR